jgi:hypothetical protein
VFEATRQATEEVAVEEDDGEAKLINFSAATLSIYPKDREPLEHLSFPAAIIIRPNAHPPHSP